MAIFVKKINKLSPLPVIVHNRGYSAEDDVEPEVVLYYNPYHLAELCKKLC